MAIEAGGANAWPIAWQEIGAVPYQLIITMPDYTWSAIAHVAAVFLALVVLVAFAARKKIGISWALVVALMTALTVCTPLLLTVDFGPKRFESKAPILEPVHTYLAPEAEDKYLSVICRADKFPSELKGVCEARNLDKKCSDDGHGMSSCK